MAAAGEEVTSGLPFQSGTVSPAGHGAGGSVGASLLVKLGPQQREWSRPHSSKLEPCAWSLLELFCRPRERLVRLLHLPGWSGLLLKEVGAFSLVPPLESSCRPEGDLPRDLPGVAWSSPHRWRSILLGSASLILTPLVGPSPASARPAGRPRLGLLVLSPSPK